MSPKVLVVDDEAMARQLLRILLESWGYSVVAAHGGADALDRFSLEVPDLLITDVNMPGMDGYELCRQVRKQWSVPIILCTAYGFLDEDKAEAVRIGVDAFLNKPFDSQELRAIVDSLLSPSKSTNGY